MRNLFFIFLFIGFGLNAQIPIGNSAHLGGSLGGTESIWLMENNGSDEKGNHTISLLGSASWATNSPAEGSYFLNADGSGAGASVPSINYTSTFSIAGELRKWGGTIPITIMSTLQSNDGWTLLYDPVNHRLGFTSGNGTSTATAWTATIGGASGVWFTFGFVINYDAETVNFYLDGASGGSGSITYTPTTYTSIGRLGIDFSGVPCWGNLDAVEVYTWKLSLDDMSAINTTPGTEVTQ